MTCPECDGTGREPGTVCEKCDGTGRITENYFFDYPECARNSAICSETCPECDGDGRTPDTVCTECGGTGTV